MGSAATWCVGMFCLWVLGRFMVSNPISYVDNYLIVIMLSPLYWFSSSSISSWWGSKDSKGVFNSASWFKWCYIALWSSQHVPGWKCIGSNPRFIVAVVVCWNWKGFGHSWQSPWWYIYVLFPYFILVRVHAMCWLLLSEDHTAVPNMDFLCTREIGEGYTVIVIFQMTIMMDLVDKLQKANQLSFQNLKLCF